MFDILIVFEIIARIAYYGEGDPDLHVWSKFPVILSCASSDYWTDGWNYLDLIVVFLCIAATMTEHVDVFGGEGQMEVETATSIRIVRDLIRSLRCHTACLEIG